MPGMLTPDTAIPRPGITPRSRWNAPCRSAHTPERGAAFYDTAPLSAPYPSYSA